MIYNMHLHSNLSHDAVSPPEEMCEAAIAAGLSGISFSDHCDPHITPLNEMLKNAKNNFRVCDDIKKKYNDSLFIMNSIELGDANLFFEDTYKVSEAAPYDSIIGSVHVIKNQNGEYIPHTKQFFLSLSKDAIDEYITEYFKGVLFIAERANIDILAHLNLPIRYISGQYNIPVDMEKYMPQIKRILSTIIDRQIALEVNTSEIGKALNATLPAMDIVALYKSMGGTLITLGSDAHSAQAISNGLAEGRDMLLRLGITHAHYYENRKPISYAL